MKKLYKKAAAAIVAIVLLFSTSTISLGQFQTPAYVRVGLFYKDGSVNTAQSVFNVSAVSGIQAGFFLNNTFTEIFREPSSATLYARKDTWFYNSGEALKEYNPEATASDTIASFTKYGPYHIKIGSDYPDQATAAAQVAAYRQAGVQAYIAYNDSWQVWTGAYLDEAAAQTDVAAITPLLGEIGYIVIPPAANRIALVNSQYQILCIFGSNTAYFQLRSAPENNPPVIKIKTKSYRGALEVRRLAASDMTLINYVTMQEYLYGSVPAEIGGRSPAEAIKAQAIAAKMYVINNRGKHSKAGFDVCPTTNCQVYNGFSCEVAQCNTAIDTVKDYVITYNGKLAGEIYYFASGGGRTEDVHNVWGSSVPYLVSVEDKYEKIYNWTKTLRTSDIKAMLPQLGNILGVTVTQTAESGRVTQLAVRGENRSDPALYLREKCKTIFGLDSQLYTITTDADVYAAPFSHIPASVALLGAPPLTAPPAIAFAAASETAVLDNTILSSTASVDSTAAEKAADDADRAMARAIAKSLSADPTQVQLDGADLPGENTTSAAVTSGAVDGSSAADPAINATQSTAVMSNSAVTASDTTSAAVRLSIPLPVTLSPTKTQLGGMKVATANGVTTLRANNNKIAVLGAGGVLRTATLVPETYTFTGKGWGHAVGMSQEGAIGMGKAGISFDQILTHYFQGTCVEPG
jgi:stage II sporulation protein D